MSTPAQNHASQIERAVCLQRAGDFEQAAKIYQQILAEDPANADALHLLGMVEHQRGDFQSARDLITRAIAANPVEMRFHNNLALVYQAMQRFDLAIAEFNSAISLKPNYPEALSNLANALNSAGRHEEATLAAKRAIELRPKYHKAYNNLGVAFHRLRRGNEAIAAYHEALRIKPDYVEALHNLGVAMFACNAYGPAKSCFSRALELRQDYAKSHHALAETLARQGNIDQALHSYRRAAEIRPDEAAFHGNLIFAMQYSAAQSPEAIQHEHRIWARRHAEPLRHLIRPHENDRSPERSLRIGLVSPDFFLHPIGFFISSVLHNFDRSRQDIICYSGVRYPDAVTERLREAASSWRNVLQLSDEELAEQIHRDRIDILIDLSAHAPHNRLLVFARKPAPVQITYLGYPGTTGLDTVDYKLSDFWLDPPGTTEQFHSETIYRLPNTYFCYSPLDNAPEVGPLPARANGRVTFASVNSLQKISADAISAWARILHEIPRSHLVMQTMGLGDEQTRNSILTRFGAHGIGPDRLELREYQRFDQFLHLFKHVDIALDAFPFSSGTTTCHCLWMGVPVIACAGQTAVQRMALSVLGNIGMKDLVATDVDQYLQIATSLAQDLDRLAVLRRTLRERMRESPLLDAPQFARDLENAWRQMWRWWTEKL